MRTIGVVGAGTMGRGIAQVVAAAGHPVRLIDRDDSILADARRALEAVFRRLIQKEKVSAGDATATLARIETSTDIAWLRDAGGVVEAVVEDLALKLDVFTALDATIDADGWIASNTSSLSITKIASQTRNPARVIGLHFFNPAPVMPLVEVVPGLDTSPETVSLTRGLVEAWGKTTVLAADTPGFIVNRVARPFYGEALRLIEERVADVATIDAVMRDRGFRLGPFELMDVIGTDVSLAVSTSMWRAFYGEPRYRPFVTQQRLVDAGRLGRKTMRGYYDYRGERVMPEPPEAIDEATANIVFRRIISLLINEANDAVHFGVASAADVDRAVTLGLNFPRGLLEWGDELGPATVVGWLDERRADTGEERYRVSSRLRRAAATGEPLAAP